MLRKIPGLVSFLLVPTKKERRERGRKGEKGREERGGKERKVEGGNRPTFSFFKLFFIEVKHI